MKIPDYNKKIKHQTYLELQEEIKRLKEQLNDEIDDELKQSEIMVKKQEEIERLNNIIEKQDKELELEKKSRQLLTDDLANVCEMSLKKDNIIKEVREYIKENMKIISQEQAEDTRLPVGSFMWNVDKVLEILDKVDKEKE